ncbi:sodium:proton antiporter, partial [Pseudomonas syringae pv. tagetis]
MSLLILFFVALHYRLNAVIFGFGYLLWMARVGQGLVRPLCSELLGSLQNRLANPVLLSFGIVQFNLH